MATKGKRVTVTTSPTQLNTRGTDSVAGSSLVARHAGAVSVYVGASDVATADGFELAAGESLNVQLDAGEDLYGVVVTGTVEVNVLEAGV